MSTALIRRLSCVAVLVAIGMSAGCRPQIDYSHELPPGMMALKKISVGEYPEFSAGQNDLRALRDASNNSLIYLAKKSSNQYFPYEDISHDRAVATCNAFLELVDEQERNGRDKTSLNQAIRDRFEVYQSIGGYDETGNNFTNTVLFTGYFTPIYEGSMTPTAEFKYPLYTRPGDLLTDPEGITASRAENGTYVPYYTRQELEQGDRLKGKELVYLKSRWDAYVITIQGSAKIRLPDGNIYEVGYAGNNGYPYTSPGKQMLKDGVIEKSQLTLRGLKKYFEEHPADMDKYLAINRRFVFFTERKGGPFGSLNVPVTTFATIATDKAVYPRAMPSFLMTQIPRDESGEPMVYNGFMLDQDTGGAIRAAGRCDIYMGVGPQAEAIAGHQMHEGQLYYVAVKPELVQKYLTGKPALASAR